MNEPVLWPRWKHMPDEGTIVHVLAMGHVSNDFEFAPLAGGLFATVTSVGSLTSGKVRIVTVPRSLYALRGNSGWEWDKEFSCYLRGGPDTDGMRLEIVPDDIADSVRALLALDGWNPDTDMPITVDDGWLT